MKNHIATLVLLSFLLLSTGLKANDCSKVYIGNIPFNMGEEDVREIFEEYGRVTAVSIATDTLTGRSKGFAFVQIDNYEDAQNAVKYLDSAQVGGRNIKVNFAQANCQKSENNGGSSRKPKY